MKVKDYVWVNSSCFCSMKNRNVVLRKIDDLSENLGDEGCISFIIKLNYELGDNIRFSILTQERNVANLVSLLNQHIVPCLDSFIVDQERTETCSSFLSYPTNTLMFGLFDLVYDDNLFPIYRMQQIVSKLMISELKEEEIDLEVIVPFLFCLHMSLAKICANYTVDQDADSLLSVLTRESKGILGSYMQQEALKENLALMQEITDDIFGDVSSVNKFSWLDSWIRECQESLEKTGINMLEFQADRERLLGNFYQHVVRSLNDQLGTTNKLQDFLQHVVNRCLWAFYR